MPGTALVTGASSGLGEVFARKLASRGYSLILVARRLERLQALATQLPVHVDILQADLSTSAGVQSVESAIRGRADLELLVNNAGFGSKGRFWETDMSAQQAMHDVHVVATLRLTRAALEGMVARAKGAVINVSSVGAFAQSEGNVSYCATKAWMNSFTEGLAIELRGISSPVRVQALCPGFTETEFHDTLGVDRAQFPPWVWLKAEDVVEDSLGALKNGPVVVIPDWKYKLLTGLMTHLPRGLRLRLRRPGRDSRV